MHRTYADFMAFPFPQNVMMSHDGDARMDPRMCLHVCQTTSAPPFCTKMEDILREHRWFQDILNKNSIDCPKCYLGLQSPPDDAIVADIDLLAHEGVRFMTLAYQGENEYGGGFATPDVGLTSRGRDLIRMMADSGIVLDLSHAGHQTARDALDFIFEEDKRIGVVATHTACNSMYPHGRGLPDDVLSGIKRLGGIIGLVTVTWLLDAKDNGFDPFFRHFDYLIDLVGFGAICLGTDGVYRHASQEEEEARFAMMKARLDPNDKFNPRLPDHPLELNSPVRLITLAHEMSNRGYDSNVIDAVVGKTLLKFLNAL